MAGLNVGLLRGPWLMVSKWPTTLVVVAIVLLALQKLSPRL